MIVEIIQKIQLLNLDHGLDLYIGEKIMKRIICRLFGHNYIGVGATYRNNYGKVTQTNYFKCKRCGDIRDASFPVPRV